MLLALGADVDQQICDTCDCSFLHWSRKALLPVALRVRLLASWFFVLLSRGFGVFGVQGFRGLGYRAGPCLSKMVGSDLLV